MVHSQQGKQPLEADVSAPNRGALDRQRPSSLNYTTIAKNPSPLTAMLAILPQHECYEWIRKSAYQMAHYTTLKEQYSTLDCMVDEVQNTICI